jgi:hypothetical protein
VRHLNQGLRPEIAIVLRRLSLYLGQVADDMG